MTDMPGSSEDSSTMIPPTPPTTPPSSFGAADPMSLGPAPTPPPLAPQHQPDGGRRRRPVRTVAGVVIAVILIGAKLAIALGAGHLIAGGSGPVVVIVLIALVAFGFLSRFLRL